MAIYDIFSQSIRLKYKATLCSKATVFYIIATILTFIPSFFITYNSQGFWKKINFYREQPEIHFKHKMLMILETSSPEKTIIWSSFAKLNKLLKSEMKTRIPFIEHMEEDVDRDGKNDKLWMSIEVPLADEEVLSVKLLLIFDYKLHLYSSFQMESMAYFEYSSPLPGASLTVVGDLALHQKVPLWHRGKDLRYNVPIIDETENDLNIYKLENVFKLYSERNVSTVFQPSYPVWLAGRSVDAPFIIALTVLYPEETIQYKVGFWQLLKWAWVQYFAVLAVFWYLFFRIKTYVFQNQLVSTIVFSPIKQDV